MRGKDVFPPYLLTAFSHLPPFLPLAQVTGTHTGLNGMSSTVRACRKTACLGEKSDKLGVTSPATDEC